MSTLAKITQITGSGVPVAGDDVDTDRIIPARFMKCVTFDGLGEYAFYDVRKDAEGNDTDHSLNDPKYKDASIMVVGTNFGCGSSREHAPQSLYRYGVRGLVGVSFAEIFFGNCTTLGIPCMSVSPTDAEKLAELTAANPSEEITIDLEKNEVRLLDQVFAATIADSAREGLLKGEWDPIALMLQNPEEIDAVANRLAYVN